MDKFIKKPIFEIDPNIVALDEVVKLTDSVESKKINFNYEYMKSDLFLSKLKNSLAELIDLKSGKKKEKEYDNKYVFNLPEGDKLTLNLWVPNLGKKYNKEKIYFRYGEKDTDYGFAYNKYPVINLSTCFDTYNNYFKGRMSFELFIAGIMAQEMSHAYHNTSEVEAEIAAFQVIGVEQIRLRLSDIIRHDIWVYGESVVAEYSIPGYMDMYDRYVKSFYDSLDNDEIIKYNTALKEVIHGYDNSNLITVDTFDLGFILKKFNFIKNQDLEKIIENYKNNSE